MDRYKEGSLADAIGYWEPIYRELGEAKGYRLAYDLGVAYAELGDATHAAERLESFLAQVDAKRAESGDVADIVVKEESDAKARLANLTATRGRIRIEAAAPPCAAQVDAAEPRLAGYVAWVSPGQHTVTFSPSTKDAWSQTIDVAAGDTVTVSAPIPPPAAPAPPAPPAPSSPVPEPPPVVRRVSTHPFPAALLPISGGLTVAAAVVAIPLDMNAWSYRNQYAAVQQAGSSLPGSDRQTFSDARSEAYAAIGVAIGLAVVTAGLTAWYFLGAQQRDAGGRSSWLRPVPGGVGDLASWFRPGPGIAGDLPSGLTWKF
jgi:hypothetical protein